MTAEQVAQDIQCLIEETTPSGKVQTAQTRLLSRLRKRWRLFGPELLHCYAIPGLPPDNLQLESRFGRLRHHQRRISGRSSTRELEVFGQAQVLFSSPNMEELEQLLQTVPYPAYRTYCQRLTQAQGPNTSFVVYITTPGLPWNP